MSDAIKKRMERAKRRAYLDLEKLGLSVVPSNNDPVCLVAIDKDGIARLIRVCIDEISTIEKSSLCKKYPNVHREIWLRRSGDETFEVHKI